MSLHWSKKQKIDWGAYHRRLRIEVPIVEVLALIGVPDCLTAGRDGHVRCPFHHDTMPSMYIYQDDNRCWCFSCGRGWDVIELLAEAHRLTYIEAADVLGQKFGISPTDDGVSDVVVPPCTQRDRLERVVQGEYPLPVGGSRAWFYHHQLAGEHYDWLCEFRMLRIDFIDLVGIGHTPPSEWPPAYTIPVWGEEIGELITVRFRRDDVLVERWKEDVSPEELEWVGRRKYWGIEGRNGVYPFGLWALGEGRGVVLLESEFDTLLLLSRGVPAFTLTMGANSRRWSEWVHLLEGFDKWVVAFDADEAGQSAAAGLELLYPSRVERVLWPKGFGGDVTDFVRERGWKEFQGLLDQALMVVQVSPADGVAEPRQNFWRGWERGTKEMTWKRK